MYLNFGEIGLNIKELVDKFQKTSKSHAQIDSIADMKVSGWGVCDDDGHTVYMYVCTYVCICLFLSMYVCIYICESMCVGVDIVVCTCVCMWNLATFAQKFV